MKKTKRYEDGGEVDAGVDALEAANQSKESQDIADQAKGDAMLVAMRDEAAKPKAKPAMSKPKPAMSTPAPEAKPAETSITPKPKTAKAGRDEMMAARRERTMGALKSVGSGIGNLFNKAVENYKSTVPRYNKEKKMASGGSVSSRADGIAQRGKTKGRMC